MNKAYTFFLKWACVLFLAFFFKTNYAQTELWGSVGNGGDHGYGYLFRTNATGDSLDIRHHFDSVSGAGPGGRFITRNGKLYGLTSSGGNFGKGVLYEFDMRTDSLVVLYHFNTTSPELPYGNPDIIVGLTESSPGVFFGAVGSGRMVFRYNLNTHTMQLAFMVPNFTDGSMSGIHFNYLSGPLFKASDGFLYGTTTSYSQCPMATPDMGSVIRINPATNAFNLIYPFSCSIYDGMGPNGGFIEIGNKLYATNYQGGNYGLSPTSFGYGCLFEYNRSTNTYTKKHDFDGPNGYKPSVGLTLAPNGKMYGTTTGGGSPYVFYPGGSGVLFEFDPATGIYTKKHDFQHISGQPDTSLGIHPLGTSLVCASNGKLYGQTIFGIYEYDVTANELRVAGRYTAINPAYPSLVETCRPPYYKTFTDSVFTLCEGSYFRFDLHNTNSTSVLWKHNGIVSSAHTSPVLEFDNITLADAGTWQCTMTNACGTTQPFALHITVNPSTGSTLSSVLTPADTTLFCPGTSITLSGNNGGVWNTGSTSASISVTQPGVFQVINTNACGEFYSNIVVVDTIPSPPAITITLPSGNFCYGQPVTLSGNMPGGIWNNGDSGANTTIVADSLTEHYVTLTHSCGTDTSNTIVIPDHNFYQDEVSPVITALGLTHFCYGDGVTIEMNKPAGTTNPWTLWKYWAGINSYVSNSNSTFVTEAGLYFVTQSTPCDGIRYSDTIEVTFDVAPPTTPPVYTADMTTFCEGDSAILETSVPGGYWSTGDTSISISVAYDGTYYYTAVNACGSAVSSGITITVLPAPAVSWVQPTTVTCVSSPSVTLTGQSPTGGIFNGTGVLGGTFDPSLAGPGAYTLNYQYYDAGTGCSGYAAQNIVVEEPPVTPSIFNAMTPGQDSINICEGDSLLILPLPFVTGVWNTGNTDGIYYVKTPGVYNFTVTNTCGTSVSNDFTLLVNPAPDLSILQSGAQLTAAEGYTYQWIDCDNAGAPLAGENLQVFTATENGNYAAVLSFSGNCADTTACYFINGLTIDQNLQPVFSFYPNPVVDYLFIESTGEIMEIRILGITGQPVHIAHNSPVNLSGISRGTYLIEVEAGNKKMQQRFIKL